jgi:hypothetical protein
MNFYVSRVIAILSNACSMSNDRRVPEFLSGVQSRAAATQIGPRKLLAVSPTRGGISGLWVNYKAGA